MEKISVVLDWFPNTNHTGFLIAEKKGYFKEEGLEVIIHGEVHGVMNVGEADVIVAPEPAFLLGMEQGNKITAVATLTQKCDSGIVSLKESGITSPAKLQGKRLTHWTPCWFHGVVGDSVRDDGGVYEKVQLVQKDVGDIVSTLGNDADATWVYENWEVQELLHAGKEINYFAFADVNPLWDFCAPSVAATHTFIEKRPEVLRAFLRALERGYIDAAKEPEASVLLVKDKLPANVSDAMLIDSQKHLTTYFLDETGHWGYINPKRWEPFADWMLEKGFIKQRKTTEYTNEFLPKFSK